MAIEFKQVNYFYKAMDQSKHHALKDINLKIDATDEFICLIGETGSGKSTLVQHMNALIKPSSGEVSIYGIKVYHDVKKKNSKVKLNPLRQKVGLVFQFPEYQLFEETVLKDIIFGPKNFGVSEEEAIERAKHVIKLVGLDESYLSRSPFNLSGGEKKRVSIAGILAMEPDILVLDEPTSGLDPKGRDNLMDLFVQIHKETNHSVVVITHDMNIVYKYASRVLVMNQSELVFDGNPGKLFKSSHLKEWNLDLPDIIEMTRKLEQELGVKLKETPHTVDHLYALLQEVL
jgi:energy-coupling factor transport system ATP-binding protein